MNPTQRLVVKLASQSLVAMALMVVLAGCGGGSSSSVSSSTSTRSVSARLQPPPFDPDSGPTDFDSNSSRGQCESRLLFHRDTQIYKL